VGYLSFGVNQFQGSYSYRGSFLLVLPIIQRSTRTEICDFIVGTPMGMCEETAPLQLYMRIETVSIGWKYGEYWLLHFD